MFIPLSYEVSDDVLGRRLWKSGSRSNRLYYIEIDDESIDKHISKIISRLKKELGDFKKNLSSTQTVLGDDDFDDIYKLLLSLKQEVSHLKRDVEKITNIELKNSDNFIIKDGSFLDEKKKQLDIMIRSIDSFQQIVEQRPSNEDLKTDLLNEMVSSLDEITASLDTVIKDDFHLRRIYKKFMEV